MSEVPLWRQEGTMEGMGGVLVNSAQVVGDLLKIAGSGTFTQVRPAGVPRSQETATPLGPP